MTTSTFRQTVADVAQRAKAILPTAVNGRVEAAVALVLAHDVLFLDNGTVEVGSASDPLKVHVLSGTTCDCADFPRAPASWCKHRIAAGIAKRVRELLPVVPEVVEPLPTPAPAPLPEAPASVNVRVLISGREVQWTLRDTDEARLAERLEALLARYPVSQAPAPATSTPAQLSREQYNALAMHRPVEGVCRIHQVNMQWNEGKNGRKGWHSHRTAEGQWCQGKGVRA